MVGQGVLRECLQDPDVRIVSMIGRTAAGIDHPKLREIVHADMWNYTGIEPALSGFECLFLLPRRFVWRNVRRNV